MLLYRVGLVGDRIVTLSVLVQHVPRPRLANLLACIRHQVQRHEMVITGREVLEKDYPDLLLP